MDDLHHADNANPAGLIMDRLADAAWDQLAGIAPDVLNLDEIALQAEISPKAARAAAGSGINLILHQMTRLDRQALLESLADIEDAGNVSIREMILEAMMHRFEIYAPYKAQIAQLNDAARRNPLLGLRLLDRLSEAMRGLLLMVGDDLSGIRGEARLRGVAVVAMMVAPVWQKDESADLSLTMSEIDKRLAQAEEWARTLRVLDAPDSDTGTGTGTGSGDAPNTGTSKADTTNVENGNTYQ